MKRKKDIWFPAKRYGVGWGLPVTWQGWAVFLGYPLITVACAFAVSDTGDLIWFFPMLFISTALLVFVCFKKGEKPKWRWGGKEK
jgi:hypothetical protein